jgi:hypothetical protein
MIVRHLFAGMNLDTSVRATMNWLVGDQPLDTSQTSQALQRALVMALM